MLRSILSQWLDRISQWSPSRSRARKRPGRSPRLCLEQLEDRLTPNVYTWQGSGVDSRWDTKDNWVGGVPQVGDPALDLIFPTASRKTNWNNIIGLTVQSITFTDLGYSI